MSNTQCPIFKGERGAGALGASVAAARLCPVDAFAVGGGVCGFVECAVYRESALCTVEDREAAQALSAGDVWTGGGFGEECWMGAMNALWMLGSFVWLVFGEVALVEPSLPRRGSIEASNHRGLKPPGYHEPPRWGEERC